MTDTPIDHFTAFEGARLLADGSLADVALAVRRALDARPEAGILVFEDARGTVRDLDLRGDETALRERYAPPARSRGRPALGVVAREVTLLPRQWDWLATQPGGVSAALRRLVDQARATHRDADTLRARREAAYRVMSAAGGDLPGFEEAARALFAGDDAAFRDRLKGWPADLRRYVERLAGGTP
ncbi:DUF2239 family protein [Roseomonas sp. HJA6]|uniref:DUF2239 family protein n=1 Tax=Roseomonas alba TaxID=2846776 RepID=A0ABS7ABL3_9PROT|nr:DUF2239 family protein [Neoroseomonas alba]MBW6399666.1 DUF2239 family protein [Neoroseomonas alba]